jgi:NAD-dependent dihydropyrimidine dehydrogenase PreA subunit
VNCLTIAPDTPDLEMHLSAPRNNPDQDLYTSEALPQTKRIMVKDEDVCLHCGLCAERCPTAAWDMASFDLLIPYAGREAPGAEGGWRDAWNITLMAQNARRETTNV